MKTEKRTGAKKVENRKRLAGAGHRGDVLARLASRGINYTQVKKIVQFDLPQMQVAFARQYGRRKMSRVLRQIEHWRKLLDDDFVIPADLKTALVEWINRVELFVFQTLLEKHIPQIDSWRLELTYVPTGRVKKGKPVYSPPSLQITAIDQETNDKRHVIISGEELDDPARASSAYRRAFEGLGLWSLIVSQPRGRVLVSSKMRPRAWPVFTRLVIPRLYELMRAHYEKPGHYSQQRDRGIVEARRSALYPRELLVDMLDILRTEHPTFFAQATVAQLKAVIQRYLPKKY